MARARAFTKRRRRDFLEGLREHGNVSKSADAIGMSRGYMYELKEKHEDFGKEWDEAILYWLDGKAEELAKRGDEGEDQDRVRTTEKKDADGKVLETSTVKERRRVKSTPALIATLQARHPDFRKKSEVEVTGAEGGPIQFSPSQYDFSLLGYEDKVALRALLDKARVAEDDATDQPGE